MHIILDGINPRSRHNCYQRHLETPGKNIPLESWKTLGGLQKATLYEVDHPKLREFFILFQKNSRVRLNEINIGKTKIKSSEQTNQEKHPDRPYRYISQALCHKTITIIS